MGGGIDNPLYLRNYHPCINWVTNGYLEERRIGVFLESRSKGAIANAYRHRVAGSPHAVFPFLA